MEVQEALPPAGVIGAEPLTLVPQHFPPQTSVALFAGNGGQIGVFRQTGMSLHLLKKEHADAFAPARQSVKRSARSDVVGNIRRFVEDRLVQPKHRGRLGFDAAHAVQLQGGFVAYQQCGQRSD